MSIGLALYNILVANNAITSKVASWVLTGTTYYAIFDLSLIPSSMPTTNGTKTFTVQDTTLNFYRSGIIDGGEVSIDTTYTLNCRAYTQDDAEALQTACYNALNRVLSADGQQQFVCRLLETIKPLDSADNYNAVIELRVRAKQL